MKKGYRSELLAKKILQKRYGNLNVIKVAIGGAQDFIALEKGRVVKVVEVKECHQKKYYPSARDRLQLIRIRSFAKEHEADFEVWIKYPRQEFEIHQYF